MIKDAVAVQPSKYIQPDPKLPTMLRFGIELKGTQYLCQWTDLTPRSPSLSQADTPSSILSAAKRCGVNRSL